MANPLQDALQTLEGKAPPPEEKTAKAIEPALPKEESHLIRSISARLKRTEDNRITLAYEIAELKKLVEARGEKWRSYHMKHILKPDGSPYAVSSINQYIQIGESPDAQQALEDMRAERAEREKERRKKEKAKIKALKNGGATKTKNGRALADMDVMQVAMTKWARAKVEWNGDRVTMRFLKDDFVYLNQQFGNPHDVGTEEV